HKVVLFGGFNGATRLGDTWELDVPTLTWTQPMPATSPPARSTPAFVWDPFRSVAVLFGGVGNSLTDLGDTWEWDGTEWAQTASTGPSARSQNAATFMSNSVVLFGGAGGSGVLGDTWSYTGLGGACASGADCDNNHCVDGVCCQQSACGTC